MLPIKKLLDKIRWDDKEKTENYEVTYGDRITRNEVRVNYKEIKDYDNEFFRIGNKEIPVHRIKKVHKNSKLVWERT